MSRGDEDIVKTKGGVGHRSGQLGSTKAEGSRMWPISSLARISAYTFVPRKKVVLRSKKRNMCHRR